MVYVLSYTQLFYEDQQCRKVAVARVLGRLRRCRRQRTVGHDDFSASLTLTLTLGYVKHGYTTWLRHVRLCRLYQIRLRRVTHRVTPSSLHRLTPRVTPASMCSVANDGRISTDTTHRAVLRR